MRNVLSEMDSPRFIVALSAAEVGTGKAVRIPLAKLGRYVKGAVRFAITRQWLAEFIANFRKRRAALLIDYEHASENPEWARGGPIPAAGWLSAIDDAPDTGGTLWGTAEFTGKAREMIQAGEYRYISPAISTTVRDKATGAPQGATLTSIALVNRPFLDAMPALALSDGGQAWTEDSPTEVEADLSRVEAEIQRRIQEEKAANPRFGPREALLETRSKYPDLFRARQQLETRRGGTVLLRLGNGEPAETETARANALHTADQMLCELTHEKMAADPSLSHGRAFRLVLSENRSLVRMRERSFAQSGETSRDHSDSAALELADRILRELTQQKVAENPSLTHGQAFKIVRAENIWLARRREELFRNQ